MTRGFPKARHREEWAHAQAEEYYARSSAAPVLASMRRPALLLSALDDPFVPPAMFAPHRGTPGGAILQPRRGGHCGYGQADRPRFWAAEAILGFLGEGKG